MNDVVCPLCGEWVDPDEAVPVHHGSPSVFAESMAAKEKRSATTIAGHSAAAMFSLYEAVKKADWLDVSVSESVREARAVGDTDPKALVEGPKELVRFDSAVDSGKAGATVRLKPSVVMPEPDDYMHPECHDSVFGGDR